MKAPEETEFLVDTMNGSFQRFRFIVEHYERLNIRWRRDLDLITNERLVLTQLLTHGPLTAADLSRRVGLSSAALTTLVDRLERANLIMRTSDDRDRRRVLLYPTKHALLRSGALFRPVGSDLDALLNSFSASERETIDRYLEGVADVLSGHADVK